MIKGIPKPVLNSTFNLQFEFAKEIDLISILQNESDLSPVSTSKNLKKSEKSISEISAWEDETHELSPISQKLSKISKKRPFYPASINSKYLKPAFTRKNSRVPLKCTEIIDSFSLDTSKLPILRGNKNFIYRHSMPEDKPMRKTMLTKQRILNLKDSAIDVFRFTPRSISNIQNAIQITPIFNKNIVRSLTSTKKKSPCD
ncbi:hypothetical protein SteCoe_15449 [Stentor coeruleus]|uniref:Uncharacterized protein n=1 Tax=Stentor coeruleus TaxID=5963 RepID=A0A1R2C3M6_9CILI|nr:hypothetical protein SteCoe_15449 [Stentor coeruleus]